MRLTSADGALAERLPDVSPVLKTVFGLTSTGHRAGDRDPREFAPSIRVHDAPGVPHPPQRDGDDALPQAPRRPRLRARPRHDPAGFVHHEAQRGDRDGRRQLARVQRPAPLRARRRRSGFARHDRHARDVARRAHGLRRRLAAAERGQPGRARWPPRDSRLPPLARRRAPHGLPDPVERARHERGVGCPGRDARRRHRDDRNRRRRPRRPAGEDRPRTATSSRRS